MTATHTLCPGCQAQLAPADGPTHRYIGASPACWALYTTLYNGGEPPLAPAAQSQLLGDATSRHAFATIDPVGGRPPADASWRAGAWSSHQTRTLAAPGNPASARQFAPWPLYLACTTRLQQQPDHRRYRCGTDTHTTHRHCETVCRYGLPGMGGPAYADNCCVVCRIY